MANFQMNLKKPTRILSDRDDDVSYKVRLWHAVDTHSGMFRNVELDAVEAACDALRNILWLNEDNSDLKLINHNHFSA